MRERRVCGVGCRALLAFFVAVAMPALAAPDLVADIEAVQGIERYRGPDAGKKLLAKNGFVVTTDFHYDIQSLYGDLEIPHFVTADSVHRAFHQLFEEHLKALEEATTDEVLAMVTALRVTLEAQAPDAVAYGELAPLAADAKMLSIQFFQVAEALLSGDSLVQDAPEGVSAEFAAIQTAEGIGNSPLFGYRVDYTQFKPRGFYTESPALERYFRVMSWFGNAVFLLESNQQTLAALMIAKALQDTPTGQAQWKKLDHLYTQFIAPCDDPTPAEYGAQLPELGPLSSHAALEVATTRLHGVLRDPAINSMIVSDDQWSERVARTKGTCFMGKRYLPDSDVFLALTHPAVNQRFFPTGLDVLAANGSARASELIAGTPEGKREDYIAGAATSKERMNAMKAGGASQYARFLRVAETLTAPPVAEAAPFARTAAYADKNLMTALAAWSSNRHAWVLHAKQSVGPTVAGGPDAEAVPPGYVEPNPAFFSAMGALVKETIALFEAAGVSDLKRFVRFESLVGTLTEIVRKELAGEPFSEDEQYLLCMYAKTLSGLRDPSTGIPVGSPWRSQIADVHTDPNSGQCLEVGTGGAMPIYVVLEHKGQPYLLVGGVYSYYEFLQPIENRLTDEEWRGQWDAGRVPALPHWTVSFVASENDIEAVIARLREGEEVAGLEFIQDPALDAYLVENVRTDSPSWEHENVTYQFREASRRAPDVVNPILLNMIRSGDLWPGDKRGIKKYSTAVAADAITGNVREEDLPELVDIMATTNAVRARFATYALSGAGSGKLDSIAIEALGRCTEPVLESNLIDFLGGGIASIDNTPELLQRASEAQGAMKIKCLAKLSIIWGRWSRNASGQAQLASTATDAEREQWSAQLDAAILEAIAAFDWADYASKRDGLRRESKVLWERNLKDSETLGSLYGHQSRAEYRWVQFQTELLKEIADIIRDRRLEGAVPFLAEALTHADRETIDSILDALMIIGSDEALATVVQSLDSRQSFTSLQDAYIASRNSREESESALRARTLVRLLEDTSETPYGSMRVCDLVVSILADRNVAGSPGFALTGSLKDRDTAVQVWIAHIQSPPPEKLGGLGAPRAPGGFGRPRLIDDE